MSAKPAEGKQDRVAEACGASGKENMTTDVTASGGSLAKMFLEGASLIESKKSDNLFQQLENRSLTEDEQKIIQNRVDLQRRMLVAYERQEKTRKVQEIRNVHTELTQEEAETALELCSGREDEAAAMLAEDSLFLRRVRAACRARSSAELAPPQPQRKARMSRQADPRKHGDQVFVGTFRGRGYASAPPSKPMSKQAMLSQRPGSEAASTGQQLHKDGDDNVSTIISENGAESEQEVLDGPDDTADIDNHDDEEPEGAAHLSAASEADRYVLARELSDGGIRPATAAEVEELVSVQRQGGGCKKSHVTPASISSMKAMDGREVVSHSEQPEVEKKTIRSAAAVLNNQNHSRCLRFLQTMGQAVARKALEELGRIDIDKAAALKAEVFGLAGAELEADAPEKHSAALLLNADPADQRGVPQQKLPSAREVRDRRSAKATIAEEATEECAAIEVDNRGDHVPDPQGKCLAKSGNVAEKAASMSWVEEPTATGGRPRRRQKERPRGSVAQAASQQVSTEKSRAQEAAISAERPRAKSAADNQQHVAEEASKSAADLATREEEAAAGNAGPARSCNNLGAEEAVHDILQQSVKVKRQPSAISARGHTNRGRVRQKSHKSAELVKVGSLRAADGWYNQGYIFPEGFESRVNFRSSIELDQLCVHECSVTGKGGKFWPAPTFKVVAMDRPDEPLIAKSCTGCWTGVLKRINAEIESRRKAGENLPPPPKTAIAGPEYFGFNQQEVQEAIEALDPEHACDQYWHGKADREAHAAGLPVDTASRQARPRLAGALKPRRKRQRGNSSDEDRCGGSDDAEDEAALMSNKWSAVSRHERYRKRCGGNDDDKYVDKDNPLPGWIDPITLEPAVSPAISPWGHVMGMATWKAILSSSGKCPFTQRSLSWEQCQLLTRINIGRFKGRIVADDNTLKKFGLC